MLSRRNWSLCRDKTMVTFSVISDENDDARTVACSQTSRRQVTWVRMDHRTLMSQRCHVFCLHAASTHLKSTRTSAGHAVHPSSGQLHGCQLRWTYAISRDIAHSFAKHHDVNSTDFISRRSIWQELNPHVQPQTPSVVDHQTVCTRVRHSAGNHP